MRVKLDSFPVEYRDEIVVTYFNHSHFEKWRRQCKFDLNEMNFMTEVLKFVAWWIGVFYFWHYWVAIFLVQDELDVAHSGYDSTAWCSVTDS